MFFFKLDFGTIYTVESSSNAFFSLRLHLKIFIELDLVIIERYLFSC